MAEQNTTPQFPSATNLPQAITGAVTRQQHKDIPVTIHYLDSLNQKLHPEVTIWGAFGAPLMIPWRTIPGYLLYNIRNFQRTFLLNSTSITLIYTKQLAAPVMVYHEDETGQLLVPPVFIRGDLNRHYQIQPLEQYLTQFIGADQGTQGTFSQTVQQLHFHYQLNHEQQPFAFGSDNALKMRVAKTAYQAPDLTAKLDWQLPANSTWQIFKTVKQADNHAVWFNLGGNLWVDSLNTQLVNLTVTPATVPSTHPRPLSLTTAFKTSRVDQQPRQAKIKASPYFPISQWTQPYGQIVEQRLKNGTLVSCKQILTLDNGSEWAQLDQGYYVEIKYLDFLD
ncbi:MucBP domain-containing protein [Lapidilactobacillus wuchangensis]|uniref:MucBP domain-containing protein n=1 Tax=Lapidilactobacillus wuchangensis TaxID=2486001 RepID=UPI000F7B2C2C|nr:MucBP domain-containing protein [Lapidilactobacillus wuchangensis]